MMKKHAIKGISVMVLALLLFYLFSTSSAASPTSGCASLSSLPANIQAQIIGNAQWYCPINGQVSAVWVSFLPIAGIAVLLAFAIVGLIFMASVLTGSGRIRNFAIGEFYEAIASALIVFMFLFVTAVIFGLLPGLFVGPINPFAYSFHLILTTISTAESMFNTLFYWENFAAFWASLNLTFRSFPLGISISLGRALLAPLLYVFIIEPIVTLGTLITEGVALLYAQYYILMFFSVSAIPVFLVPGVIFRTILPTRALGGIMMALAISFYLIMPILFSVAYYFTTPTLFNNMNTVTTQLNKFTPSLLSSVSADNPIVEQLQGVNTSMASFWLLILFYPMLIIAVTYAFTLTMADFLGGATKMGSRLRGGFI